MRGEGLPFSNRAGGAGFSQRGRGGKISGPYFLISMVGKEKTMKEEECSGTALMALGGTGFLSSVWKRKEREPRAGGDDDHRGGKGIDFIITVQNIHRKKKKKVRKGKIRQEISEEFITNYSESGKVTTSKRESKAFGTWRGDYFMY